MHSQSGNLVDLVSSSDVKTWDDAEARWLVEKAGKASLHSDKFIFGWLRPYLQGKELQSIDRAFVDVIKMRKISTGVKPATVNRTLALVRSVLRAARDWEWTDGVPKIRLLAEPKKRVRYLLKSEAESLLIELPSHLSHMAAFSLATGLRKGNVLGLEWSQVDLAHRIAWIHPDQSKSRVAIGVPLNQDAIRILCLQLGVHPKFVFTYYGKPVHQTTTAAWYKALKRCGITNFRWHDLRHTWASWHVQGGTPLHALRELGGWESDSMVRRYAHFSVTHLAVYAGKLPSLTAPA